MPKKRHAFIDKKRATTYRLVHKDVDDDASDGGSSGDYELVTEQEVAEKEAALAAAAHARHPLSFLYTQDDDLVQTEAQRQEILDRGLPDDGYNYLRHLRAPGHAAPRTATVDTSTALSHVPEERTVDADILGGTRLLSLCCWPRHHSSNPNTLFAMASAGMRSSLCTHCEQYDPGDNEMVFGAGPSEAAALPDSDPLSQFQPPEEDIAFIDARALAVRDTTEDDDTATRRRDDVVAFARPVHNAERLASALPFKPPQFDMHVLLASRSPT